MYGVDGGVRGFQPRGRNSAQILTGRCPREVEAGRSCCVDKADLNPVVSVREDDTHGSDVRRGPKQDRLVVDPQTGRTVCVDPEPVGPGFRGVQDADPVHDVRPRDGRRVRLALQVPLHLRQFDGRRRVGAASVQRQQADGSTLLAVQEIVRD